MKECVIDAVLPFPEKIWEVRLPRAISEGLCKEITDGRHAVLEEVLKSTSSGRRRAYRCVGRCECNVREKLIYLHGKVSYIPETAKYISLAIGWDKKIKGNVFFVFTESSAVMNQTNFTVRRAAGD